MPRDKIESLAQVMSLAAEKARSMSKTGGADGHASEVSEIARRIEAIALDLYQLAARTPPADAAT